eukprot:6196046-Pleurochrysis_carterae.AAC.2
MTIRWVRNPPIDRIKCHFRREREPRYVHPQRHSLYSAHMHAVHVPHPLYSALHRNLTYKLHRRGSRLRTRRIYHGT